MVDKEPPIRLEIDAPDDGQHSHFHGLECLKSEKVILWSICGRFVVDLWSFCGRFVVDLWSFLGQLPVEGNTVRYRLDCQVGHGTNDSTTSITTDEYMYAALSCSTRHRQQHRDVWPYPTVVGGCQAVSPCLHSTLTILCCPIEFSSSRQQSRKASPL